METDDNINDEAKGPAKKLGLSKVVYSLGMSARDSLLTFVAATAALFPVMYYGQGKGGFIDKLAAVPDSISKFVNEKMGGDRAGKFGKALAISAGLASLVGYVAHVPGLIRGPKKVQQAEDMYNAEVNDNRKLAQEVKSLSETVKRQGVELTEAKMQDPKFAEHIEAASAAEASSATPFSDKFKAAATLSQAEKLAAERSAGEAMQAQRA